MSIQPVVTKFHNSTPHEKSVTPVFRTQQYLFNFILKSSTKSKVRSLKQRYIPLFVLNVLTSGSLSPCSLTANSFTSYSASYSRPVILRCVTSCVVLL